MNQSISPTDATQSALSDESIFGIPPAADRSWFSEGTAIAASSSVGVPVVPRRRAVYHHRTVRHV